jgi:hypothetical protein
MIIKKEFLKRYKQTENVFRQIAEEKPYLVFPFNEKKFHTEAEKALNKRIRLRYIQYWLSGYRARKGLKIQS